MKRNFDDLSYLKAGNPRQQQAYVALQKLRIFEVLTQYDPTLTGTIPIEVDLPSSDLDIICEWKGDSGFAALIKSHFRKEAHFKLRETNKQGLDTLIASFLAEGFEIEIFGQNFPVRQQMAYLHMIKEYEILQAQDDAFRLQVIQLKQAGHSTEAAFAQLLGIEGDPYTGLLEY